MGHLVFDRLIARCKELPRAPFAVVAPTTEVALSGAMSAAAAGLIEPILVGRRGPIQALAARLGVDLSAVKIIEPPTTRRPLASRWPSVVRA